MMALAPFIRIGLRYLSAYLVTSGLASDEIAASIWQDEVLIGVLVAAATEGWYWFAKRVGGAT